jgi:Fur family transcriptional regulator, ferric uptake regulator
MTLSPPLSLCSDPSVIPDGLTKVSTGFAVTATMLGMALGGSVHDAVALRLAGADQRYTAQRRVLVEILGRTGRPIMISEILEAAGGLTQSSVYRNIAVLIDVGVVERIAGTDDYGRFELAEAFAGHHHHLVCERCGTIEDFHASTKLERALGETARLAAAEQGYVVNEHRLDLRGLCLNCAAS